MQIYTVSFFGHRIIENPIYVEQRLEVIIRKLLKEKEYVAFLVGRDGAFDQMVSSAICRCKREYRSDNSAHILVLPYLTAQYRDNEEFFRNYYDEIEICEAAAGCHYKNAHQTRNRAMANRLDLVVFCIQHFSGGAWQTMKYVRHRGIPCININEQLEEAECF